MIRQNVDNRSNVPFFKWQFKKFPKGAKVAPSCFEISIHMSYRNCNKTLYILQNTISQDSTGLL